MNTTLHPIQTLATAAVTSLVAVMVLALVPSAAHASRLPSDPFAFSPTPFLQARMITDAHAASVWAALHDLRTDVTGAH